MSASASGAPAVPDLTGTTVDGFQVRELLGRGGMGEVYKAHDTKLDRTVALKIVSELDARDREFAQRFEREARAASGLSHPNVAHIYATGRFRGRPYYVMEYVEGRSLAALLDDEGRLTGLRCLEYLKQCAEGLRAALEKGVIHRDIKPDNLMVDTKGQIKIVDFGLARRLTGDVKLTQTSMVVGTPRYMSPEQATAAAVDHRSDIYSLGACFYHLFAGEAPFDAETPVALMMKHVSEPLTPLKARQPNVPQAVAGIVDKMLAKSPQDRYQTYDELLADVEKARAGRLRAQVPDTVKMGGTVYPDVPENPERSWVLPIVLLIGVFMIVIVVAMRHVAARISDVVEKVKPGATGQTSSPLGSVLSGSTAEKSKSAPAPGGSSAYVPASLNAGPYITMALHSKSLANMKRLSMSCQVYQAEHDEMPDSLSEIYSTYDIPAEEQRDGWAHLIRYEKTARNKFRLTSDGPDGKQGTADDIIMDNGLITQGEMQMQGVPTSRQQRGLDPPPAPFSPQ